MNKNLKRRNTISIEEKRAVNKVLETGILSDYLASDLEKFNGGKSVLKFENKIKSFFNVKYAITFNSWTSGLIAAVGSLDLEHGDEIITSPFTMSACPFSIIFWNLKPVFADIDKNTFCLNPKNVEKKITKKTRAIMLVDINGHPSDIKSFKKIAKKHNLKLIIDAAQSIGAKYKDTNKFAGTVGDIGGFSLNVHKHINTGEGGIIVTNNKKLAIKAKLIRNHGENIADKLGKNFNHFYGFNFRMGEIEAAIGYEQLKKFPKILKNIQFKAKLLNNGLRGLKGLKVPDVYNECTHAYYNYPLVLDLKKLKTNREKVVKNLKKQGVILGQGYLNLHLLPFFKKKNNKGIKKKFSDIMSKNLSDYQKGACPVAEELHAKTYFSIPICYYEYTIKDILRIIKSFKKVWKMSRWM